MEQVLAQWQHCMWAHTLSGEQAAQLVHPQLRLRHVRAGQHLWHSGDAPQGWTQGSRPASSSARILPVISS